MDIAAYPLRVLRGHTVSYMSRCDLFPTGTVYSENANTWQGITVGHSITLALAVTGLLTISPRLVEFLIPLTIMITAVENIVVRDRGCALWNGRYRPVFAGVFGLVHGAGFASYLKSLFVDRVALPLFGFNVGIEIGQIVVLIAAFTALYGIDRGIEWLRLPPRAPAPLRVRVLAVSSLVAIVAAHWAVERAPW